MKSAVKRFAFWLGIAAVLLVLGREFIYTSSQWQNVLILANMPLSLVLHAFFSGVLSPIPAGGTGDYSLAYLPYYILFVLTYVGYGLLIDLIILKFRKHKMNTAT